MAQALVIDRASSTFKEVKCKVHNEFIFLCTNCEEPVCKQCVSERHAGHTMADMEGYISKLMDDAKHEIQSKHNLVITNLQKMEQGLTKFDVDVTSVINEIIEDGNRIKALVDKEVEEMITVVKEKAAKEKEQLSSVISSTRQLVEETNALEKRRENLEQIKEVAALIGQLKALTDEMSKLPIIPVQGLPLVNFSPTTISSNDIIDLLGTFSFSDTDTTEVQVQSTIRSTAVQEKKKPRRFLYKCSGCGKRQLLKYVLFCPKCPGNGSMDFIKEVSTK